MSVKLQTQIFSSGIWTGVAVAKGILGASYFVYVVFIIDWDKMAQEVCRF